jgi:DNA mismatch repair protein MutL
MNRIRLLSEQVANQIAAGEVVERPASVVKELVENALDAQATRVTIDIQTGGRSLIRVTDDGVGMSRDDALLCLERHATSKIRVADDLSAVRTMGFRGEALPSIASVSRFTLLTKERVSENQTDSTSGTQVVISGGKILEVKDAGSAAGTSVEVRSLFFNLPARRKFLRSEETERAHIQHYISLAALAYPEVAFTFLDDKRLVWQLPQVAADKPGSSELTRLKERLRGLYGTELDLLGVDFHGALEGRVTAEESDEATPSELRVWGFIGAPGVSRATREEQHLFVNRRPVENRGLNFALLEGYHTALMKGRYPVCCLFLEIDPAAVDVNIHPTKREVKFHQEQGVRRLVTQAVRETLLKFHSLPRSAGPAMAPPARCESAAPPPRAEELAAAPQPIAELELPRLNPAPPPRPRNPIPPLAGSTPTQNTPASPSHPDRGTSLPSPECAAPSPGSSSAFASSHPGPVPLLAVPLRILGVIGRLYVVMESDRGLVLLDQHAAHERVLFEQMLRRVEQGQAPSQRLLLPETIELSARDAQFLREQLACLTRLGVGVSEFGERTFLLDSLPPFVKASDPREFVLELLDSLKAAGEGVNSWRLGEHTVAKTVCRHAVKANDPLSGPELEQLVADLRQCAMPYTCPHGRPTLIEMSFRELEKKFGRAP